MQIEAPFELVLFGGMGDLALRKLIPALFLLHRDGRLPEGLIYATTRQEMARDDFTARIENSVRSQVAADYLDPQLLDNNLVRARRSRNHPGMVVQE